MRCKVIRQSALSVNIKKIYLSAGINCSVATTFFIPSSKIKPCVFLGN